ncbi:TNF receptor-associated factor 2-like isoform X2 [Oculina patagonica]
MAGYQLSKSDLKNVPSKYICRQCKFVLRDPLQTPCAHFYCRGCLEYLKSDTNVLIYKCIADDEEFKPSEVFPDGCVRNEIRGLLVHCLYNERGCDWEDNITGLEEHLVVCDYEEIPCNKCETKVLKSNLAEHLQTECIQRQVECDYCSEKIAFADCEDHKRECQYFPIACTLCNKKDILRGKLQEHHDPETGDCEGSKAICPFRTLGCKSKEDMKRSEKRHHEQTLVSFHLNLLVRFVFSLRDQVGCYVNEIQPLREGIAVMDRMKTTVSQLVSQVTAVVRENGTIQDELHDLRSRVMQVEENLVEPDSVPMGQQSSLQVQYRQVSEALNEFKLTLRHMEDKFANHELLLVEANQAIQEQNNEIVRLKRQDQNYKETLQRLQTRVESMGEALRTQNTPPSAGLQSNGEQDPHSFDGVLLWKISDVAAKIYDSFNEPEKSFYSPPFYTSRHGYKMRARIYLNGDGMGKGTHISLFFVIMRGEYDALLRWPFRQKVTFMMLDQNNVEHVIDAFRPDPNSSSFRRPRRETNIASGCPLFFPLAELNKHAYIKDDAMFVKVIVDCSDL